MAKLRKERFKKPKGRHRPRALKWVEYHCSACDKHLHKTARFCTRCGAWFKK